jgi:enamine deaminase RidA (YjgF/YER057c/UK114 family)
MKTPKSPSRRDVALGLAALGSVPASAADVVTRRVNPPGILTPRGYTHVVTVTGGRTVYISGQISANAKGEVVGKGDLKAQTTQVFENLKVALLAAGASQKDVVKICMFVVNLKNEDLPAIRGVRDAFFENIEPPASTLVGVTALAGPEWLLEIEAIAVVA